MNATYSPELVAISVLVAIFASYTALELAGRVSHHAGASGWAWLAGGAVAMGAGIWSMHFIGMLAVHLPVRIAYDAVLTALSMVLAVLVSALALFVMRRRALLLREIGAGAVLMGFGISAMHYTGMRAMRMFPAIQYDPHLFAASIAIAMGAAFAALLIAFRLRDKDFGVALAAKFASAVAMGAAITGMHYTGMAAARFAPGSLCLTSGGGAFTPERLGLVIALATLVVLLLTLTVAARDANAAAKASARARELHEANQQLSSLVHHDALTGLANRVLLAERMQHALSSAGAAGSFGLMFVDLDGFKPVNDRFGHGIGDELLRSVASRLTACVRKTDTVARTGGDEFVVVLGHIDDQREAATAASKILGELRRPFSLGPNEVRISGSIGISIYPRDARDVSQLEARADEAMYRAKRAGRGTYRFFVPLAGVAVAA